MLPLGTLTCGPGAGVNNTTTAVPFTLSIGVRAVSYESDTDGVLHAEGPGSASFSAATGAKLYDAKDANVAQGPFALPLMPTGTNKVAIWNPGGGTVVVKVWGDL